MVIFVTRERIPFATVLCELTRDYVAAKSSIERKLKFGKKVTMVPLAMNSFTHCE